MGEVGYKSKKKEKEIRYKERRQVGGPFLFSAHHLPPHYVSNGREVVSDNLFVVRPSLFFFLSSLVLLKK